MFGPSLRLARTTIESIRNVPLCTMVELMHFALRLKGPHVIPSRATNGLSRYETHGYAAQHTAHGSFELVLQCLLRLLNQVQGQIWIALGQSAVSIGW